MTVKEALFHLGVRENTLTDLEKVKLDEEGFLVIENLFSEWEAVSMASAMNGLFEQEKTGFLQPRCINMQNKSSVFDICFKHPRFLAAIVHILGDNIRSLGIHASPKPPCNENQALHTDGQTELLYTHVFHQIRSKEEFKLANSVWMLTDFTEENGATRVIPGTHLIKVLPSDIMKDPKASHPDEQIIYGKTGSVIIFNAYLWHGMTRNRTPFYRMNVNSFWRKRESNRRNDWGVLTTEAWNQLNESERCLFWEA